MKLRNLIDEDVLEDAREIDDFVRKHDNSLPSLENTFRLVRDIDTEVLRRVGNDVWGVGGSPGGDLVRTSFDGCIGELDRATAQASAWTGAANNAYKEHIDKIKKAINDMRSPSEDVGEALVAMGDAFDQLFGRTWVDILTIMGLVIAAIGVIVAVVFFATGIGAIIGLVVAIIGLIIAAASFYVSMSTVEENKIKALEVASAAAIQTMESARKATY